MSFLAYIPSGHHLSEVRCVTDHSAALSSFYHSKKIPAYRYSLLHSKRASRLRLQLSVNSTVQDKMCLRVSQVTLCSRYKVKVLWVNGGVFFTTCGPGVPLQTCRGIEDVDHDYVSPSGLCDLCLASVARQAAIDAKARNGRLR